jgi:hypothetical protein
MYLFSTLSNYVVRIQPPFTLAPVLPQLLIITAFIRTLGSNFYGFVYVPFAPYKYQPANLITLLHSNYIEL